jgi:hypothetical protein
MAVSWMFDCALMKYAGYRRAIVVARCVERVPGLSFGGPLLAVDHGQLSKN